VLTAMRSRRLGQSLSLCQARHSGPVGVRTRSNFRYPIHPQIRESSAEGGGGGFAVCPLAFRAYQLPKGAGSLEGHRPKNPKQLMTRDTVCQFVATGCVLCGRAIGEWPNHGKGGRGRDSTRQRVLSKAETYTSIDSCIPVTACALDLAVDL
jgi:hypothetical protein